MIHFQVKRHSVWMKYNNISFFSYFHTFKLNVIEFKWMVICRVSFFNIFTLISMNEKYLLFYDCRALFIIAGDLQIARSSNVKLQSKSLITKILRPGVNFINILRTAFALLDPKSVKSTVKSPVSFYAFGIYECKSCT